jgi:hypothetical protein
LDGGNRDCHSHGPMARVILMFWITGVWVMITSPITFALVGGAAIVRRVGAHRGEPSGVAPRDWLLPGAFVIAVVLLGGLFGNHAVQPPARTPIATWVIGLVFVAQVVYAVVVTGRARRQGVALAGMFVWLWLGALASWIAGWSVTAGGTLGAL